MSKQNQSESLFREARTIGAGYLVFNRSKTSSASIRFTKNEKQCLAVGLAWYEVECSGLNL